MSTRRILVLSLFALLFCGRVARAEAGDAPRCLPSALDAHALPPAPALDRQAGHLFVIELQNIGSKPCTLFQPFVELLPPSGPNNSIIMAPSPTDQEHYAQEWAPKRLEPGEWGHVLLAWVSRVAPEISCDQYSELKLHVVDMNPGWKVEDRTAIEVRNLWIRSCILMFVSGYRKGRYSPQSKVPAEWLQWPAVPASSFPEQPAASEIHTDSPLLKLHTPVERTMLGDHLQLRLKFPRGADAECAFRLLRKRESSGATIVSVQQCGGPDPGPEEPVPQYLEGGIGRLEMRAFDLLPQESGSVSYEVVAAAGKSGSPLFASEQIKLIARDPTLPSQAVILNPLPACKLSQLQIDSLDPVVSARLQTLRAYQAMNASNQACSVAGVPALRFLDDKGTNEPFVPKPCPNCDNDLFKTRPNGRIDLKPGDVAHFLVGVTAIDTEEDPWMHCQRAASLEFTAPGSDKPLVLPLDAALCAAIDISAWRPGAFDRDPQNVGWGKAQKALLQDPATPPPPDCNKPDLLAMGRPSMMPSNGGVAWGLSLASHTFVKGEPIPLHIWIDNSGDQEAGVSTCMELDYFKARGFDLYDAYGHRVLSHREVWLREQCAKDPRVARLEGLWSCTRNLLIPIPPHTCINGDNYDFTAPLAQEYELPPGQYTVRVREGKAPPTENICEEHQDAPFVIAPGKDLTFEVVQP